MRCRCRRRRRYLLQTSEKNPSYRLAATVLEDLNQLRWATTAYLSNDELYREKQRPAGFTSKSHNNHNPMGFVGLKPRLRLQRQADDSRSAVGEVDRGVRAGDDTTTGAEVSTQRLLSVVRVKRTVKNHKTFWRESVRTPAPGSCVWFREIPRTSGRGVGSPRVTREEHYSFICQKKRAGGDSSASSVATALGRYSARRL